ncbi:winged helix-turn-helix transcriptional regulator [Bacteroides thetaiotaomicron]|uniref:winged helix-turn-helix transcriptional regulator n=1 Tax=Bacteroides thetaiotaomicron TaxID=818 RepID=UPI0018A172B7|nr:helix-turn-helix domain-containing protein [Bacteroides thetaiotaomicron]MDC2232793.1 winged helix-turn-helix transcriptional regulator [Bacteroides thetaiotaomicron]
MTGTKVSYRRVTENIAGKLDLLEACLFYCLALCSDCYTMVSNIKQKTLTEFYGIKKEDQIREWLHKFEDLNLIQINKQPIKGKYGSFDRCSYILNTEHYVLISNKLYNEPISRKLKGFLVLLKCKCLNGTNTCKYTQSALAKELNISESSISRYLKLAEDEGYIKRDDKGIHLKDRKMFIITSESTFALIKNVYPNILTDEDIAERKIHNYNE